MEFEGTCPICERATTFRADHTWLRDALKCVNCGSIPRERALMHVIDMLYPHWRDLAIHESSPVFRGVSLKLRQQCRQYVFTQFNESMELGAIHSGMGYRNEDLENQTFESGIFDLVVTQDVFEHLFDPLRATTEIMRTLKPAGAHVFSVPIVRKNQPTRRRALRKKGQIAHVLEPEYHGNPVSDEGALVTVDWGYDILTTLSSTGFPHSMFHFDLIELGIRAEYIEILVGHRGGGKDALGNPTGEAEV